jgi:hypothetical protein
MPDVTGSSRSDIEYTTEKKLIEGRRDALKLAKRPEKNVGLALSGGGIRSATFSLGLLQAMAKSIPDHPDDEVRPDVLSQVDLLSTVSGGGYTGMFLGSLFMPRKTNLGVPDPVVKTDSAAETPVEAADRALRLLRASANAPDAEVQVGGGQKRQLFHPFRWLRENGRYLTPGGSGDALYLAAYYLRALIGVQYVIGIALLGAVLLLLPARWVTQFGLAAIGSAWNVHLTSIADESRWCAVACKSSFTIWWSPLLLWPAAILLLIAGPLILTYWVAYRSESYRKEGLKNLWRSFWHRSWEDWTIELSPLVLAVGASGLGFQFFYALHDDPLRWLLLYVAFLGAGAYLLRTFGLPLLLVPSGTEGNPRVSVGTIFWWWKTDTGMVANARLILTRMLATTLGFVLVLAVAGLIDSIGQSLFAWVSHERRHLVDVVSWAGVLGFLAFLLRKASELSANDATKRGISILQRFRKEAAMLAALVLMLGLAIAAAMLVQVLLFGKILNLLPANQSISQADAIADKIRYLWLAVGWAVLFVMTWWSEGFLNHSTFHRFYAARLTRTFLGAANFARLSQLAAALTNRDDSAVRDLFVSESHPEDDLSLRAYYRGDLRQRSVGPLHLINVTVNESLSLTSNLVREDRMSFPLCIGPVGIRAGESFFPWANNPGDIGSRIAPPSQPITDDAETKPERLSLGAWCAISGAAASTGMGHLSGTGYAMLAWLFNARLGYWWRAAKAMMSTPSRSSLWGTFDLVYQEFLARFYGRRGLRWNLSDGGHFENTAAYELIRRRLPFIICSDNGADPHYGFSDVENLIRRVRIDFGAEVRLLGHNQLAKLYQDVKLADNSDLTRTIGDITQFKTCREQGERCALLGLIDYPAEDDGKRPPSSILLLIKPSLVTFAPEDVRLYAVANHTFPQQTTADQFFNEAQWESYRRLGEAIGSRLFKDWQFFRNLVADAQAGKPHLAP